MNRTAPASSAGLELPAMGAVVRPVAGGRNPLAGGNYGGMTNDGDQFSMTTRLDPDDAKSVVGILVGDALNQPGKDLTIGWFRLCLHNVYSAGVVTKSLPNNDVRLSACAISTASRKGKRR
jgi:hypothetical protein